jgi:hypothetical protein
MKGSLRSYFRFLEILLVLFLLGTVGAEVAMLSPPVSTHVRTLSADARIGALDSHSVTLAVRITHGAADEKLHLVAFPAPAASAEERRVYVYYDGAYPTASVDPLAAQGIIDNLAGELLVRHYSQSIVPISEASLVDVLQRTQDATSEVIVAMTGVMPSSVFSRGVDQLTPWIRAGGLLVWGGAAIGYYAASKNQALSSAPLRNGPSLAERGTEMILGAGIATFPWHPQRSATMTSPVGSALGIQFQLTSGGIKSGAVLARGGQILGWYDSQYSSVTYLPLGAGGLLIFGGEILDAASVSRDVAHLLVSRAIYGSGQIAAKDIRLSDIQSTAVIQWSLPFGPSNKGITFIAWDPASDGAFYFQRDLDV